MSTATSQNAQIAVVVGRFQPFHRGHLALLTQALALAPRCIVVIGSAFQARTPKNPFTWSERVEMIRLCLSEADRARVRFLPMRDHYDESRWAHAVREGVEALFVDAGGVRPTGVTLIGHFKDATSGYLRGFPGWRLHAAQRLASADGTHIRDVFFGAHAADATDALEPTLAALTEMVPPSTLAFMRSWAALPCFADLSKEWRALAAYKQAWANAPYPPVFVTVDAIVRCAGHVLLIQRGKAPGRGLYAVPGGFVEARETLYQSALRELEEETHLKLFDETLSHSLQGIAVFDHPDRSLRGRTITHAHFFDLGERDLPEVRADDDAQSAEWMPIDRLTGMEDRFHDDHFHMLDHFLGLTQEGSRQ